ncbi:Mor transcription activator family protein [Pseudacidovorax intermedius]|uniref:Mor transcription activator family protein n=1 Tax=Pseudacidovorax intermedius TaxID=433924 RepID=UPI0034E93E2E
MTHRELYDPLSIIEGEARAVAESFGAVWNDEAASSLIRRISQKLGGSHFHVPKASATERESRAESIRQLFNGKNIKEWARALISQSARCAGCS